MQLFAVFTASGQRLSNIQAEHIGEALQLAKCPANPHPMVQKINQATYGLIYYDEAAVERYQLAVMNRIKRPTPH